MFRPTTFVLRIPLGKDTGRSKSPISQSRRTSPTFHNRMPKEAPRITIYKKRREREMRDTYCRDNTRQQRIMRAFAFESQQRWRSSRKFPSTAGEEVPKSPTKTYRSSCASQMNEPPPTLEGFPTKGKKVEPRSPISRKRQISPSQNQWKNYPKRQVNPPPNRKVRPVSPSPVREIMPVPQNYPYRQVKSSNSQMRKNSVKSRIRNDVHRPLPKYQTENVKEIPRELFSRLNKNILLGPIRFSKLKQNVVVEKTVRKGKPEHPVKTAGRVESIPKLHISTNFDSDDEPPSLDVIDRRIKENIQSFLITLPTMPLKPVD